MDEIAMRVILVPVADRPECKIALNTAFDLGKQLGSNIIGCHIRPHSDSRVRLPPGLGPFSNFDPVWEAAWKEKMARKSSASAKALFGKMAEAHGLSLIKQPRATPGVVWQEKVGSPDKVLSIAGPVSDLIIVSRPASKRGKVARLFLFATLLNSSRPVLILPQASHSTIGQNISIAWNQSAEAAQAVAAAMPLLVLANKVNIITCGQHSGGGPKATQLATYLRFWGIKSERVSVTGSDHAKGLIKAYKDTQSDLLVMGAYSRSRLRERIFGGVTEYMIERASIPVLMLHT